jgi:hypothetical protein
VKGHKAVALSLCNHNNVEDDAECRRAVKRDRIITLTYFISELRKYASCANMRVAHFHFTPKSSKTTP